MGQECLALPYLLSGQMVLLVLWVLVDLFHQMYLMVQMVPSHL